MVAIPSVLGPGAIARGASSCIHEQVEHKKSDAYAPVRAILPPRPLPRPRPLPTPAPRLVAVPRVEGGGGADTGGGGGGFASSSSSSISWSSSSSSSSSSPLAPRSLALRLEVPAAEAVRLGSLMTSLTLNLDVREGLGWGSGVCSSGSVEIWGASMSTSSFIFCWRAEESPWFSAVGSYEIQGETRNIVSVCPLSGHRGIGLGWVTAGTGQSLTSNLDARHAFPVNSLAEERKLGTELGNHLIFSLSHIALGALVNDFRVMKLLERVCDSIRSRRR